MKYYLSKFRKSTGKIIISVDAVPKKHTDTYESNPKEFGICKQISRLAARKIIKTFGLKYEEVVAATNDESYIRMYEILYN